MHVFVFEDQMLDWHSCQICYPLETKLLLLLLLLLQFVTQAPINVFPQSGVAGRLQGLDSQTSLSSAAREFDSQRSEFDTFNNWKSRRN